MLKLREHQQEVVDKIREGFKEHRCQLLYAPTGFGKTEVAMAIMKEISMDYKRVAMILDRVVLVDQTSERLDKYGISHGVMQAQHWRNNPTERIQICSAQTLERRQNFPDIELIIIDECHIKRRGTIEFIKNNPNIKVIGLTATPFTAGLGDIYSHVVSASSTGDLIQGGWLCPLKVFIAKEVDMTGAKKVAGEWTGEEVSERGIKIVGDVVTEWVRKTNQIFGEPRKTIVFCAGVNHGRALQEEFTRAGYNFKSISYKEDDEFKRETIEDFSKPDTKINGLIATDILTRGFDVTDVMIGVSARPFSKSFSSHVQQLGRVMRSHPNKEFGVWLDHSGNYLRFRDDWDKLYDEGVDELQEGGSEKAKPEPTLKEKKESKCPYCKALWTSTTDKCDNCGKVRTNPNKVLSIFGLMEELNANVDKKNSESKSRAVKQDFYSELLFYARAHKMKDGWAYHTYKEKYGVHPTGLKQIVKPITPDTHGWVKSKFIKKSFGKRRLDR
jgi:superfamily II DNA or RNA helicase